MRESTYKSYDELPLFLNARMVSRILGVSQSSAYELMNKEGFPSMRIGNRWWFPERSSGRGWKGRWSREPQAGWSPELFSSAQ